MGVTPTVLSRAGKYEEKIRKKRAKKKIYKKNKVKVNFPVGFTAEGCKWG